MRRLLPVMFVAALLSTPAIAQTAAQAQEKLDGCAVMKALSTWIDEDCLKPVEPLADGEVDLTGRQSRGGLDFRTKILKVSPANRVPNNPAGLRTHLINFDLNSAELNPSSTQVLEEIVTALVANPESVYRVEGHTDHLGDSNFNFKLSAARAAAVVQYLKSRNIDGSRLQSFGYGDTRPLTDIDPVDPLNRRVEIKLEGVSSRR